MLFCLIIIILIFITSKISGGSNKCLIHVLVNEIYNFNFIPSQHPGIEVKYEASCLDISCVYVGPEIVDCEYRVSGTYDYCCKMVNIALNNYEKYWHANAISIDATPGSGKTTLCRQLSGLDIDEVFTEAIKMYKLEQDFRIDIQNKVKDIVSAFVLSRKFAVVCGIVNMPLMFRYKFAINLPVEEVFARLNKREINCIYSNKDKLIEALDSNKFYITSQELGCRVGIIQYRSFIEGHTLYTKKLIDKGYTFMSPQQIVDQVSKISSDYTY